MGVADELSGALAMVKRVLHRLAIGDPRGHADIQARGKFLPNRPRTRTTSWFKGRV